MRLHDEPLRRTEVCPDRLPARHPGGHRQIPHGRGRAPPPPGANTGRGMRRRNVMESSQEQAIAFLKGEMTAEEKRAFEERLVHSPALRTEIERSRELLD